MLVKFTHIHHEFHFHSRRHGRLWKNVYTTPLKKNLASEAQSQEKKNSMTALKQNCNMLFVD